MTQHIYRVLLMFRLLLLFSFNKQSVADLLITSRAFVICLFLFLIWKKKFLFCLSNSVVNFFYIDTFLSQKLQFDLCLSTEVYSDAIEFAIDSSIKQTTRINSMIKYTLYFYSNLFVP